MRDILLVNPGSVENWTGRGHTVSHDTKAAQDQQVIARDLYNRRDDSNIVTVRTNQQSLWFRPPFVRNCSKLTSLRAGRYIRTGPRLKRGESSLVGKIRLGLPRKDWLPASESVWGECEEEECEEEEENNNEREQRGVTGEWQQALSARQLLLQESSRRQLLYC